MMQGFKWVSMGAYGFYVWGAYGFALGCLFINIAWLRYQRSKIWQQLKQHCSSTHAH